MKRVEKKARLLLGLILLASPAAVCGQELVQYLPQVADGAGWETTFIVVNQASTTVNVSIQLVSQNGAPLPALATGSSAAFALSPAGSARVRTLGSAGPTLRVGYARVQSTGVVGAAAFFQFFDADGNLVSQAGVLPAPVVQEFSIPAAWNPALGVNTGLAIASPPGCLEPHAGADQSGRQRAYEQRHEPGCRRAAGAVSGPDQPAAFCRAGGHRRRGAHRLECPGDARNAAV